MLMSFFYRKSKWSNCYVVGLLHCTAYSFFLPPSRTVKLSFKNTKGVKLFAICDKPCSRIEYISKFFIKNSQKCFEWFFLVRGVHMVILYAGTLCSRYPYRTWTRYRQFPIRMLIFRKLRISCFASVKLNYMKKEAVCVLLPSKNWYIVVREHAN